MKSWGDPQHETLRIPNPLPTRATVAAQLQASLAALLAAEAAVLDATLELNERKHDLLREEDRVCWTQPGQIDGKNEADRARQLRHHTAAERALVEESEAERLRAVSALEGARATFSMYRALARLLAGEDR